jgi:tetratricopeptide (TPR) repeat protein
MALVDVMKAQGATGVEVESVLEEALRRDPEHASVNSYYARLLDATGRSAAAEVYVRRAVAGDPLSPNKWLNFVNIMLDVGKPDEARRALEDTAARWPLASIWWMQVYVAFLEEPGQVASLLDNPNSAASAAELDCWRSLASTAQLDGADRRIRGAAAVDRCVAERVLPAGVEIEVRMVFGDIEGAMATLQRLTSWNEPGVDAALHARAAPLQYDSRFMPVMQRLGLVDMWRSSDRWPDFCALATLPYDCRAEAAPL